MTRKLSPALLARIDRLSGCQGRWIVDCREIEGDRSYALRNLQESCLYSSLLVPVGDDHRCWALYRLETLGLERGNNPTPEDAALYCAHTGWQARLLFCSDWLDDDSRWPGGYDAPSIICSNARVFREDFARELERADGDADGIALDVRYVTAEMLETIQALESYPLISEEDHSAIELELQQAAWEEPVRREFRERVGEALQEFAPEGADAYWGEERACELDDAALLWLFEECGPEWEEQVSGLCSSGYWCDLDRLAERLSASLLAEATGLPLLAADQRWRHDAYPWPGAPAAPLICEVRA